MDCVQADETKLTAAIDCQQLPDLLNLSSFLGLTGFFRDLIKGYVHLAQPLTAYADQQHLDSYSETVDHAVKCKQMFNRKVLNKHHKRSISK